MKFFITLVSLCLSMTLASQTNIFPDNGKVGIGTTSPYYLLDIINTYTPTEAFLRLRVQDAPDDYLAVTNFTGADGQFIPLIKGHHTSDNRFSLALMGQTTDINDNGTNALVSFDARRTTGPVQTRPLFAWRSYTTNKMLMLANGNLGIGTEAPEHKLDVRGVISSTHDNGNKVTLLTSGDGNSYLNFSGGTSSSRIGFQIDGSSKMSIYNNGSVAIGTGSTGTHKLAVEGSIGAREIKVEANGWSDYVFEEGYDLPSLEDVAKHIREKGHLINIPTAQEVEQNGVALGEMSKLLLEKIEELTLYTLQQQEEIKEYRKNITLLNERLGALEKQIINLKN